MPTAFTNPIVQQVITQLEQFAMQFAIKLMEQFLSQAEQTPDQKLHANDIRAGLDELRNRHHGR